MDASNLSRRRGRSQTTTPRTANGSDFERPGSKEIKSRSRLAGMRPRDSVALSLLLYVAMFILIEEKLWQLFSNGDETSLKSILFTELMDHSIRRHLDAIHFDHKPDYGGIEYETAENFRREIPEEADIIYHRERYEYLNEMDEARYREKLDHPDELSYPRECYHPSWTWKLYPSCNAFHEITIGRPKDPVADHDIMYMSHGYFRDSWVMYNNDEYSILKTQRLIEDHEVDPGSLRYVQVEAIIMEGLTKSPRIIDIFGHCGTSIIAEPMPREATLDIVPGDMSDEDRGMRPQKEIDQLQTHGVFPLNNLTTEEKLIWALNMSEAIADIHGFEGGLIVHGDIHPDQWLISDKGELKLNDFNNGVLMDWNPAKGEYCKYWTSFGGFYKSPEEFRGDWVDEQVDTWSHGHNLYGLLTGMC